MAEATEEYLTQLRKALRKLRVPLESEALADAREFLHAEYPDNKPSYANICETLGLPIAVAHAYLELSRQYERHGDPEAPRRWYRFAPGWNLTCLSCGKTTSRERFLRIGVRIAWSVLCFRLYWCTGCRGPRVFRLWNSSSVEARWIRGRPNTMIFCFLIAAAGLCVPFEGRAGDDRLLVERFETAASLGTWSHLIGASIGDGATSRFEWDEGSLRLEAHEDTQRWYAVMRDVRVDDARCIRVRARMRAEGVNASQARYKNANLFLRFPDGRIELVKYVDGTSDWAVVVRRFRVPEATESVRIGCFLSVPGRLWFDDIEIDTVSDDWSIERHGRFEYHFQTGESLSEESIAFNEESLRLVSEYLEIEAPDRIRYVKYRDLDMIEEYTGRRGNAHRSGATIHSIWPTDRHEVVHILADGWGDPTPLLGEGLAVFLSGQWQGKPIREFTRRMVDTEDWVSLASLLSADDFFRKPERVTYAIAGAFVEWVDATYGRGTVRELYSWLGIHGTAAENRATMERVLGLSLEEAEARMRRYISGD